MFTSNFLWMKRQLAKALGVTGRHKARDNIIDIHPIMSLASWFQRFAGNDKEGCIGSTLFWPH
jgi:hypothetical protein